MYRTENLGKFCFWPKNQVVGPYTDGKVKNNFAGFFKLGNKILFGKEQKDFYVSMFSRK